MSARLALLDAALGALLRRRGRSIAVALALATTTALFASTFFLAESLRATSTALAEHAPAIVVARTVAGRPAPLDTSARDAVAGILGVRGVRPRVWGYLYLSALEGNVTVMALGEGEAAELALASETITLGAGEAAVGPGVARALGLRDGDRIAFAAPGAGPEAGGVVVLRAARVLGPEAALLANDVVLAREADARAILELPPEVCTDLAIDVFPPEETEVVAAEIVRRVPGARVTTRETAARALELTFDARAGLLGAVLFPVLFAFLLLAWERLSGLSAEERHEIGVMKAVGWSTSDVLTLRVLESGLVALVGAALGVVAAYVHVFVLGAPGLADAMLGWSNLRPELALAPALGIETLLGIVAAVVVPFALVAAIPAWRASMLDPDRAMRGDR